MIPSRQYFKLGVAYIPLFGSEVTLFYFPVSPFLVFRLRFAVALSVRTQLELSSSTSVDGATLTSSFALPTTSFDVGLLYITLIYASYICIFSLQFTSCTLTFKIFAPSLHHLLISRPPSSGHTRHTFRRFSICVLIFSNFLCAYWCFREVDESLLDLKRPSLFPSMIVSFFSGKRMKSLLDRKKPSLSSMNICFRSWGY
ncbi:hypothetical protein ACP275_10G103900 [Erythranthe tilingii]